MVEFSSGRARSSVSWDELPEIVNEVHGFVKIEVGKGG